MATKQKELALVDSLVLADYILYKGGPMSHLKLQKMLFYVQAYHLAYFEEPLIEDDFRAWAHGPVSRKLYDSLKDKTNLHNQMSYKKTSKGHVKFRMNKLLTSDQKELVNEVIEQFSPMSGLQLENLTHHEKPWIKARKGLEPGDKSENIISRNSIMKFYRKELHDTEKRKT